MLSTPGGPGFNTDLSPQRVGKTCWTDRTFRDVIRMGTQIPTEVIPDYSRIRKAATLRQACWHQPPKAAWKGHLGLQQIVLLVPPTTFSPNNDQWPLIIWDNFLQLVLAFCSHSILHWIPLEHPTALEGLARKPINSILGKNDYYCHIRPDWCTAMYTFYPPPKANQLCSSDPKESLTDWFLF
jgi:hypothetical protein